MMNFIRSSVEREQVEREAGSENADVKPAARRDEARHRSRGVRRLKRTLALVAIALIPATLLSNDQAEAYGGSWARCVSFGPGFQYVEGRLPYRGRAIDFRPGVTERARLWVRYGVFDAGTRNPRYDTGWYGSSPVSDRGTAPLIWRAPGGALSAATSWIWGVASTPRVTRGRYDIWEFLYIDQAGRRYGPFGGKLATCTV